MVLRPEIVDSFRFHDGKVFKDIEKSKKFENNLWDRMRNGDIFDFDWKRGMRDLPDENEYDFPMADYLISQEKGLTLKKILGQDVKIVTQRKLLKDLMYMVLWPPYVNVLSQFHFERFGDVLFVKQEQVERAFEYTSENIYLDKRREFFSGDDLPGCIGSTPVEEFEFPDNGKAYSILTLKRGNSRILYSCAIKNFSPDGEPIDTILSGHSLNPKKSKERAMLLHAATDCYKHHMFFKMANGRAQMEFPDTDTMLEKKPYIYDALETTLDLLLDEGLLNFLANRRGCTATLYRRPELQLKPHEFSPDYKSFLTPEFFTRFFDDEDL